MIYPYKYICYISIDQQTRFSSCSRLISVARVTEQRTTDVTRVLQAPGAELSQNACGEQTKKILFSPVFARVFNDQIQSVYINRHVFRLAQDSSVCLGLPSREQLMSPECSVLYMYIYNYQFCSHLIEILLMVSL